MALDKTTTDIQKHEAAKGNKFEIINDHQKYVVGRIMMKLAGQLPPNKH